jgi:hypothetical protein
MFSTTFRGAEIVESPSSTEARRHLTQSIAVTVGAPLIVFGLLLSSEAPTI